jgi:hypothetical protein
MNWTYNEANLSRYETYPPIRVYPRHRRPSPAYGAYVSPEARKGGYGYVGMLRRTQGGWSAFPPGRMTAIGVVYASRREAWEGLLSYAGETKKGLRVLAAATKKEENV